MKYWLLFFTWGYLSVSGVLAQKRWTQEDWERVKNPILWEGADTLLSLDCKVKEVGVISEDDAPSVYSFSCRNISHLPLVITRLYSSCGCTEAVISQPVIPAGEKAVIQLTYHPFGRPGEIDSQVVVYADCSEEYPVAVLNLSGRVTPSAAQWKSYRFAWGDFKVRRKKVNFGKVKQGQNRVEKIMCGNASAEPMRVFVAADKLPAYLSVYTLPEVLEPSEEGVLVIAVDGDKLEGISGKELLLDIPLEGVMDDSSKAILQVALQY